MTRKFCRSRLRSIFSFLGIVLTLNLLYPVNVMAVEPNRQSEDVSLSSEQVDGDRKKILLLLESKYRAKRMKRKDLGIGFTVSGLMALVTSPFLLRAAFESKPAFENCNSFSCMSFDYPFLSMFGYSFLTYGVVATGSGVVLLRTDGDQTYKHQIQQLKLDIATAKQQTQQSSTGAAKDNQAVVVTRKSSWPTEESTTIQLGTNSIVAAELLLQQDAKKSRRGRRVKAGAAIALGLVAFMDTPQAGLVLHSYGIFLLTRKSRNEKEWAEYQQRKTGGEDKLPAFDDDRLQDLDND